jgi:glucose-6-phosphate 1-epimerase
MKRWGNPVFLAAALLFVHPGVHSQDDMSLAACIHKLRRELPSHREVRPQTFDLYTRDAADLRPLIDNAARAQPEFQLPIWDYLVRRVDAQRVAQGLELLERQATALGAIEQRHGVDAATLVAVFGIETDYGRVPDTHPVVDATLSRACLNLKSAERRQHFFAALWLLQEGVVQQADFKGSWSGAFGLTQFMPGTFVRYLRDGPAAPASDIIHSLPDALATTARYLKGVGWSAGRPWGVEVQVPAPLSAWHAPESDHGCLLYARPAAKCRSIAAWSAAGVTLADGAPLRGPGSPFGRLQLSTPAALLLPAGPQGPAWLVTPNYHAIWRYNRADAYALAIGLLSDRLRGGPPQRVAWPTDDPGLSRAELVELQGLLLERGHCAVTVDGAEGPRTRAAIRDEEQRSGLPVSGRAGTRVLTLLRAKDAPVLATCLAAASGVDRAAPAAGAALSAEAAESAASAASAAPLAEPAASAASAPRPAEPAASAASAPRSAEPAASAASVPRPAEPASSAASAPPSAEPAASAASAPRPAEAAASAASAPPPAEPRAD